MSLVDFRQIVPIGSDSLVDSALPSRLSTEPSRPQIYDPLWGFFTFGQDVVTVTDTARRYQTQVIYHITGGFTPSAELSVTTAGIDAIDDLTRMTAVVDAFERLESLLLNSVQADAPADPAEWGTAADPRLIELPAPLRDRHGQAIYAQVTSFSEDPDRFTTRGGYRVELMEPERPIATLAVNDVVLDHGRVRIQLRRPVISEHHLLGCCGALMQVENFESTDLTLSGTLPRMASDGTLSPQTRSLMNSLAAGVMSATVTPRDGLPSAAWPSLKYDGGIQVDSARRELVDVVQLRARSL